MYSQTVWGQIWGVVLWKEVQMPYKKTCCIVVYALLCYIAGDKIMEVIRSCKKLPKKAFSVPFIKILFTV